MPDINETLAQRGSAYGDFREQGRITQNLKKAMQDSPNWGRIPAYMKEGLDMVQHKVSRILNGNPFYDDNFHDIIGYTKLMQDRSAQDVENGVTFEVGGDPMYPTYEHTERVHTLAELEVINTKLSESEFSKPSTTAFAELEPLQDATREPAVLNDLFVWEPEDNDMLRNHKAVSIRTLQRILALTGVSDDGKIAIIQNIVGE